MSLFYLVLIIFLLLAFIRVPVAYALLTSTMFYFIFSEASFYIVIIRLFRSYDSFIYIAIPLFILTGKIMSESGLSDRLINLSDLIVGRFKGGLAHVNIVVSMFFGGITGTAISDTSAIGSMLIPAMVKKGYTKSFSAAVTAASSTMGPIIPPSLMFIIYGSLANVSIAEMFIGGIIPGIMVGLLQMGVVVIYSKKYNFPRREKSIKFTEALKIIKDSILVLLLPIFILGGIALGIVSPTEAALIAVFYSLFVSVFIFRIFSISEILGIIKESAIETGSVCVILAAAGLFGFILSNEQIPYKFSVWLLNFTSSKFQILLLINVMLFIIGMFMDSIPAIIIITPIFLPILMGIGINPVHAGIFMCINLITGVATPPVGCCIFAASLIAKESLERVSIAIIPFIITNIIVTLLVTYIPRITLFLPSLIK